jgi:hypothetical protein
MIDAHKKDLSALKAKRPALHKLELLTTVESILKQVCGPAARGARSVTLLQQRTLHETLLDYNILETIRNWLMPWPAADANGQEIHPKSRNLPNLTLR